jgi:phytoene desaturase
VRIAASESGRDHRATPDRERTGMKVAVVGAGVGGLACAVRLAARGHDVVVFDAHDVGGMLASRVLTSSAGEFRFDTGPSLLTLPQVFEELFAATGAPLDAEVTLRRLDPSVRHVFPDGSTLDSGGTPDEFRRRVADAFGAGPARDWDRLIRRARRVWQASWQHVLTRPVTPGTLAALAWRIPDLAAVAPGRTLRGVGRSHLRDPRLRMLLERYATYTGSDPRRAPAALVSVLYAELAYGGWYVEGGLATLAQALLRRCEALGVRVHTGVRVASIDIRGGRAAGVRLADDSAVAADAVVANADLATVYGGLLPRPARMARLRERSLSGFVLLLGVRGPTRMAHHTVSFPTDYDAEFDALFGRNPRPVPDPAIFVTVPRDPAVHPAGFEAWTVLVNAPPHGAVDWDADAVADRYADAILSVLARRGVDVRDRLVVREVRTPADLERETFSLGGAIYGTPRHGPTGLLRPGNRSPLPGLYFVGGSVHPGGGLPMVALSAQIVADLVAVEARNS